MTGKGIVIREAHFPGRAPIEAYGNGGFRFADMSHRGSLMCLPSGIHGWEPADPLVLTVADFDKLLAEAGKVEILLVGMGRDLRPLPAALRAALKA
ncbi:MTH938/NDUFAF3 family protein, partial [Mesorhizobium sp. M7A.F.Ca.CA.001.12.1.1]